MSDKGAWHIRKCELEKPDHRVVVVGYNRRSRSDQFFEAHAEKNNHDNGRGGSGAKPLKQNSITGKMPVPRISAPLEKPDHRVVVVGYNRRSPSDDFFAAVGAEKKAATKERTHFSKYELEKPVRRAAVVGYNRRSRSDHFFVAAGVEKKPRQRSAGPGAEPQKKMVEESRFDTKLLNFSVNIGLSRDRQGRKVLKIAPGDEPDEVAWLQSIEKESNAVVARRLGISDRQVRRIKSGKVSVARLREHAKREQSRLRKVRRPYPSRVRAALSPSFYDERVVSITG